MPGGSEPRHIETSSRKSTLQTRSVQTDTAGTLARVVEAATQLESVSYDLAAGCPVSGHAHPQTHIVCPSETVP